MLLCRHTGLEEPGFLGDLSEMAEFYATRARGGVALIVTGGISPNAAGRRTAAALWRTIGIRTAGKCGTPCCRSS